ncbi:unnamed protein product [Cunninghamella blakesleeana]
MATQEIGVFIEEEKKKDDSKYVSPVSIKTLSSFIHTTTKQSLPRKNINNTQQPSNKWGRFQRIVPTSLVPVNVRDLPRRPVPTHIPLPFYAQEGLSSNWAPHIPKNTEEDIQHLRKVGQLAKKILLKGGNMCKAGTTTEEIDRVLHEAIISEGAYPSPLNYMGFPKSICTSVNNIIAHGIPNERPLENGDIINIDVTVYLNGYHGDTSYTFYVGQVDDQGKALVECTKECLEKAIQICGPHVPYKEIGRVISEHASKFGYSISDELSGHGIGKEFHCLPLIYHHVNDEIGSMTPGTVFTIEPILCQGSSIGLMYPDEWTISTVDGGRSAQFEHTVLVTDDGVEILTL